MLSWFVYGKSLITSLPGTCEENTSEIKYRYMTEFQGTFFN